jgi:hypothetical protein
MRELTQRKGPLSMRYTLLSCLLTICIESYLGNQENALAAAQIGIDMIKELATEESWCTSFKDIVDHVLKDQFLDESDLVTTFAWLESNIIMFNSVRHACRQIRTLQLEGWGLSPGMPALFANVKEARMYCDLFGRQSLTWREVNLQRQTFPSLDFGNLDPMAKSRKIAQFEERAREKFILRVKAKPQLLRAFLPVYESARRYPGSKDYVGASILMIQYIASNIWHHLPGQNSEIYFDQFKKDMGTIVEVSRKLLETYPFTRTKRSVFSFDDGVVKGLFLVCTCCRDPTIRKQALELLIKYPRREGLSDSMAYATVAT